MTFKELAKKLTEIEGKKKQVNIAQMSEILKALSKLMYEDPTLFVTLYKNGKK